MPAAAREFCPKCRATKNMQVTTSRRKEPDGKGGTRDVRVRSYHCESCHGFVRSERVEAKADSTGS